MSAGVTFGRLGGGNKERPLWTDWSSFEVSPCSSTGNSEQQPRQTLSSSSDLELRTPTSLTQEELQAAAAPWLPGQLSDDGKDLNFLTENDTNFMLRWAEGLLTETQKQQSDAQLLTGVNNGALEEAKNGVHQRGCLPVYTPACGVTQCQETPTNSQHLGDPCLPRSATKAPNKRAFPPSQKCASLACATAPDVQWYKCCTGSSPNDIVAQYASGRTVNVVQFDGVLLSFDDTQAVQVLSSQNTGDVSVTTPDKRPACRRQLWPEERQKTKSHDITEGAPWYFNFSQKIPVGTSRRPGDCTADRSEASTPPPHGRQQQATPRANKAKRRHLDKSRVNRTYKGSGLQA
ncbi:Hypp507 [Branchiostoma lanceolatum]|uniref:Hypp507 protein n=1 Tax=Branchiostoma lanceolatum TaxID=7740 RepID=A0A8J9YPZ8_BRALA|nr:Hypp507 [Branchiostoma lanceolatum]